MVCMLYKRMIYRRLYTVCVLAAKVLSTLFFFHACFCVNVTWYQLLRITKKGQKKKQVYGQVKINIQNYILRNTHLLSKTKLLMSIILY